MTELGELTDATLAVAERRRAGRRDYHNPHLVALLRTKALEQWAHGSANVTPYDEFDDNDQLRPARGIALTVLIGIPMWGGLASAFWLLWRFL
jgi:hypothetical protein